LVTVETNIALAFLADKGDLLSPLKPAWPPQGQKVVLPITRDTWISSANGEQKGSTLMDVVFGRGHIIWKFAECEAPDADGWQICAVDADVIAAKAAGLSEGFCLFDEIGHEWSLKKENSNIDIFRIGIFTA
jgi:hypothetical protein